MFVYYVQFFITTIYFFERCKPLRAIVCDQASNSGFSEGNIGEVGSFPWLGILRVHLHERENLKIALTRLIYIKAGYTIANADDIIKIPRHIFREDSRAMFIPTDKEPWFCKVKDYMTHPEYEFATLNTIALVELASADSYPMQPICLPAYSFNASSYLYAISYTDDNRLLEKIIYKLDYVDLKLCDEFYKRSEMNDRKLKPIHYQCGYAKANKANCIWENGMAIASNSMGKWNLIGLSIKGPGCAAPSRFIEILPYIPWIDSATTLDQQDFRKSSKNAMYFNMNNTKILKE